MSMRQSVILAVLLLCGGSICHAQSEPTLQDVQRERTKQRSEMHAFLFDEFIPGREFFLSDDEKSLSQVLLQKFDGEPKREQSVKLNVGFRKICSMFDRVVMETGELQNIPAVELVTRDQVLSLDLDLDSQRAVGRGRRAFRMPSFPVNKMDRGLFELRVRSREPITLGKVRLLATKPIEKEFEQYNKRMLDGADQKFETYADVANSLGVHSDPKEIPVMASMMSGGVEVIQMLGVLANPKTSMMYEILSRMDQESASALARKHFDIEFKRYCEAFEDSTLLPTRMMNGMRVHLFLCSEFCTSEELVIRVRKWVQWHQNHKQISNFQFKHAAGPDYAMLVNLYANKIAKQHELSDGELRGWLAETLFGGQESGLPNFRGEKLYSLDSQPQQKQWIASVRVFQQNYSVVSKRS